MQLFQTDLASPAELLARDEALLEHCETTGHPGFLTFWESATWFAVLGYGKKLQEEVFVERCAARKIPVLRRCSGGGTVLQGPGCLSYALILPVSFAQELETITGANRHIMGRIAEALQSVVKGSVAIQGHTDLTVGGLKFSGNAQRRKRRCLLFHGSFLLGMDLDLMEELLRQPRQQPEYRLGRSHQEFVTNLDVDASVIQAALQGCWDCQLDCPPELRAEIEGSILQLAGSRYSQNEWNERL